MRRALIFFVTIALGAGVLWYFEKERMRGDGRPGLRIEPIEIPDPPPIDPEDDVEGEVEGGADPGGADPAGDDALGAGEVVRSAGMVSYQRPYQTEYDPDDVRLTFFAADSESLDDRATALRLFDIVAEAWVWSRSTPPQDVLRTLILAKSGVTARRGSKLGDTRQVIEIDLTGVILEQKRETPLAPLIVEAPFMKVHFDDEQFRSVDQDLVEFRSHDVRGWGRGLIGDLSTGELQFGDGADVTIDVSSNLVARIQTPTGGTLRVVEITPPENRREGAKRTLQVIAREGVRATIRDDGTGEGERSEPISLDAQSLDVWLEFGGDGERPRVLSARADGEVHIVRASDAYYGDTALFTFAPDGEPTSVVLEDEPRLEYRLVSPEGEELNATVSGVGPLTAHFIGADEERRLHFDFTGPGRITAIERGADITFSRRVRAVGKPGTDSVEAEIEGDVRIIGNEGSLAADRLGVTQTVDGALYVRTEDATRITRRSAALGLDQRLTAGTGLSGRLVGERWFVDRATDVVFESLGDEPFRVEAGSVEDLDVDARTLTAQSRIEYRTAWGAAFAPVALVRDGASVRLDGTDDDPVRFEFLPEDEALELEAVDRMGVRTGEVRSPRMTVTEGGLVADGNVEASIETAEGLIALDCSTLDVERRITGEAFGRDEAVPVPAGVVRAPRAESLRLDAVAVRSARYDTDVMRIQFRSERLVVVAPVTESADGDTGVAAYGETRFNATGDVDGTFEVLSVLDAREDPERRRPIQTATFRAAEAILTRGAALAPTVDPNDAEYPFTFRAREVDRFVLDRPLVNGTSAHYELECETLDIDGEVGKSRVGEAGEPIDMGGSALVAGGSVKLVYRADVDQPTMRAQADALVLTDGERGVLAADEGRRVTVRGLMPGATVSYRLESTRLEFDQDSLTGENAAIEFPPGLRSTEGLPIRKAGNVARMTATRDSVVLLGPNALRLMEGSDEPPIVGDKGSVRIVLLNANGAPGELFVPAIEFDPRQIAPDEDEGPRRSIGPNEPVPSPPAQEESDDEQVEKRPITLPIPEAGPFRYEGPDGFRIVATLRSDQAGPTVWDKLTAVLPGGEADVDLEGLELDLVKLITRDAEDDYLIRAERGVVRGFDPSSQLPWSFEFAEIDMNPIGDEILVTIVAPRISFAGEYARADYIALWIDRARWRAKVRSLMTTETMPETFPGDEDARKRSEKPNYMADLLFQVQSEKYGRYVRALFMEGGVEIARADRRAAKGSRLYLGLDQGVAWLQDAELVYPLSTRGEEVPMRVRTERLETDETGRLVADGATLTTCDHDVPHFVVRSAQFRLEPRPDGRWRFNASGNRLRFEGGWQLPLPSIGNLVLDEEFGVEGFENEAGEVTPLRDIGIARTARFGTVLGAAFRFDVGDVGAWIGERIGMNADNIRGKWDTEAQWLTGRGPLLGLGLALRERKPGDDPDEDFRLDAYLTGVPDDGEDQGTVRVPTDERDDLRLFGWVRSRYPIVRGEWVDVAIASQTDAGVQPEFREGEYLRFEQRDTFVRWRKEFGADYLTGGVQKRIDDYRSQKEELPSFFAYRGERMVGRMGGAPVLWGGELETGWFTRREGELQRDLFSDLPGGALRPVGNRDTGRADLRQTLYLPVQSAYAGIRVAPFLEGRGTAWTDALDGNRSDPGRLNLKSGVELSTTLHKVTQDGFLHALAPRFSVANDLYFDETGGAPIPLDVTEDPIDGTRYEAGLRAIWLRPRTFENLDFDLRMTRIENRENGLPSVTRFGALAEYITRYGDGEGLIGLRHDARYDVDEGETVYSRSALAWRPSDVFLTELRYSQALALDETNELYEVGALVMRARLDPKWEVEAQYVQDLRGDEHLLTEVVLRRFSHDFVFDLSFQDRTGEGGINISFSLLPLLGWARRGMGMLDRR